MTGTSPGAQTRVVAVLGHPIAHSLSPVMHNAAFRDLDLDYIYVALDVEPSGVAEGVEGLRALNFAGANVTIPHKQAVMDALDEISPVAERIGAVNTIVHRDGQLHGTNTDAIGFQRSVEQELGFAFSGSHCVVIGAGGSARAVVAALADASCAAVTIVNRTVANAEELANTMTGQAIALADTQGANIALSEADLIVNTTSVGMHDDTSPVDAAVFKDGAAVYDLIYSRETRLLRDAAARGLKVANGLGMLVEQGAESFALWTGQQPSRQVMRDAIDNAAS